MSQFSYPYVVRRSARARHVRLVVSAEGLVVVVPERFSVSRDLPPLLESKKEWIKKALEKVTSRVRAEGEKEGGKEGKKEGEKVRKIPDAVDLLAVGERWRVERARLRRDRMIAENGTLVLTSDFSEEEAFAALRRWVHSKGLEHLPDMLRAEAGRHGFSYAGVAVKEQKSIWGSCSSRKNINLNCRLLFLPPRLARHILLHELCHLKEMNHSRAFHDLLAGLDPDAAENELELKRAWRFVPLWIFPPSA